MYLSVISVSYGLVVFAIEQQFIHMVGICAKKIRDGIKDTGKVICIFF